jgi:hypothetical protein
MAHHPPTPRREIRKLKDLKPFPLQGDYFDDLSDHDLKALAGDIKKNGLRNPVEVLSKNKVGYPPNTILSGHERKRALELNGETEALVVVRHDLGDVDAAAIEREFLAENQHRRQLDPLARARVAVRLYEIERNRPRGRLWGSELTEARDRVGKAIGMGGRNLNRYVRVLRCPTEVQDALRAGRLPLIVAEKVCDLDAKTQKAVAERLRGLDLAGLKEKARNAAVKQAVFEFLPEPETRHRKVIDAVASFARGLRRGMDDLDGRVDEVRPAHVNRDLKVFKKAHALLRALINKTSE